MMDKTQLATGLMASIVAAAIFAFIAAMVILKIGPVGEGTFLLLGWVSGMIGMFVAASD